MVEQLVFGFQSSFFSLSSGRGVFVLACSYSFPIQCDHSSRHISFSYREMLPPPRIEMFFLIRWISRGSLLNLSFHLAVISPYHRMNAVATAARLRPHPR